MTSTGIYLAAIGAALFASLLVAWLWGRRKRRKRHRPIRRVFTAGTERERHVWDGQQMWVRVGVNKWQQHAATPETLGGDEWTDVAREFILAQFDASFEASFEASERTGQTRPATPAAGAGGSACLSRVAASPYASSITGTGSRPEAPWVTREEALDAMKAEMFPWVRMLAHLEQHVRGVKDSNGCYSGGIEARLARLEAGVPTVAGLTEDQWNTPPRLVLGESKRGGEGWRAFKAADWTWVWTGEELHVRFKPCQWTPSGYSLPAELYEQVAGVTELHGPERARIVREFLEWKGAQ